MRPELTLWNGRRIRVSPARVVFLEEIELFKTDDDGQPTSEPEPGGPFVRVTLDGGLIDVRGTLAEVDAALDVWENATK